MENPNDSRQEVTFSRSLALPWHFTFISHSKNKSTKFVEPPISIKGFDSSECNSLHYLLIHVPSTLNDLNLVKKWLALEITTQPRRTPTTYKSAIDSWNFKKTWWKLWWVSSCSESFRLLEWLAENTASGQGSPRERSPVGFRFSESLFLDVPGTATEQVRICGFRRKSSSLDKAPKIRDSNRLRSLESFLVTLTSISSETWEMYSWANPRSSVFCDWLFLVFSGASLETAAKFPVILQCCQNSEGKSLSVVKIELIFNL